MKPAGFNVHQRYSLVLFGLTIGVILQSCALMIASKSEKRFAVGSVFFFSDQNCGEMISCWVSSWSESWCDYQVIITAVPVTQKWQKRVNLQPLKCEDLQIFFGFWLLAGKHLKTFIISLNLHRLINLIRFVRKDSCSLSASVTCSSLFALKWSCCNFCRT